MGGENIFLVSNGVVNTPPLSSSVLPGITRESVIQICQELGLTIKERTIQRAALYVADELFFSGTAAEITPIRSVDRIAISDGKRGEITSRIQKLFFEITSGVREPPGPWLTYVREQQQTSTRERSLNSDNGNVSREMEETAESRVSSTIKPKLAAVAHASAD